MSNPQKQQIIKAVGELGRRVTVADVAAKTGQSLQSVAQALNVLASESNATLEVTETGEIFYCYRPNFYYAHLAHGFARIISVVWDRVLALFYFAFRMSFGVILLVSIITVSTFILVIQTILEVCGGGHITDISRLWIEFGTICSRFLHRQLSGRTSDQGAAGGSHNFLTDCFSFLFGDGNPNGNVEEIKWQLIAQTIRLNEGVVVAEHLAPYLTREPDEDRDIFTVLAKFGGIPEVSESGNIVYVFPDMRVRSEVSSYALVKPHLEQKPWQFSYLTKEQTKRIKALAIANIMGSWCLILVFAFIRPALANLFRFFFVYSILCLLVPAVRSLILRVLNNRIKLSNQRAQEYEDRLGNPSPELVAKLEDAERMRQSTARMESGGVIYTTAKDLLDQAFEQRQ